MKLQDIAGFCPEEAIWRMLADVSRFVISDGGGYTLDANTVAVDGSHFMVTAENDGTQAADMVWALGALAYYAATGHEVFGGHGAAYQQEHPSVALPSMPKTFQALTAIVHACLCYDTSQRTTLQALSEAAQKGLDACAAQQRSKDDANVSKSTPKANGTIEKWPEEMSLNT